ncbi:MAG: hypothetical protein V4523_14235 [Pseudomonadota bacterium]
MTDRAILFSAPMIEALLSGRKTQTRRILSLPPAPEHLGEWQASTVGGPGVYDGKGRETPEYPCVWHSRTGAVVCPRFAVGDRLWVREAWRTHKAYDDLKPSEMGGEETVWPELDRDNGHAHGRYRHARFMPRWASRLTLIVTDVRVERLQDCSEADAWAEGLLRHPGTGGAYVIIGDLTLGADSAPYCYRMLWDHINGAGAWAANPWIVAISFDVRKGNIDNLETAHG